MRWGLKGEALLPPSSNDIRRRKDARLKRGRIPQAENKSQIVERAIARYIKLKQKTLNKKR